MSTSTPPIPIWFAPLQGFTTPEFIKSFSEEIGGVERFYQPFTRLEKGGLRHKDKYYLKTPHTEKGPYIPQMLCKSYEEALQLVNLIEPFGYQEIDINMGCSFPPITKHHYGAGLLPFPDQVADILRIVEEFPHLNFSIKLRLGLNNKRECLKLLPLFQAHKLTHLTLHSRLSIDQYKNIADEEAFAEFYEGCTLPLVYNGDLNSLKDLKRMTQRFPKLKALMIGRGLLADPLLALHYLGKEENDKEKLLSFHQHLLASYKERLNDDHQLLMTLKSYWQYFLPFGDKKLCKKIKKCNNINSYETLAKEYIQSI